MRLKTKHENGVALIITLSLLVVATIVVTGFLVSMRTERQAAQAMANSQLTDVIAQDAVQHAIAILDNNIPQPIPPGQTPKPQNWIVSPGLLTKITGANGTTPQYIPLSTNTDYQNPPPAANSVDLNAPIPLSSPASNYMDATAGPILATWVNVLQNPLAPASATNPIVGRYAFWMDDENAKINVNTAYGKPAAMNPTTNANQLYHTNPLDSLATSTGYAQVGFNAFRSATGVETYPGYGTYTANSTVANAVGTSKLSGTTEVSARLYPLWHPSAVNLDLLGNTSTSLNRNALADWVFNGVYNSTYSCVTNNVTVPSGTALASILPYRQAHGGRYRPLAYPEQIMQFVTTDGSGNPTDPTLFSRNKFNLTAYNRAPEFNAFGKPRLLLESRIRTQSSNSSNDSVGNIGVSGAETEFYQTPDFDPQGPMYFHGDDNSVVYNAGSPTPRPSTIADLGSAQMVADYISTLLNRNDWPGMPQRSFVDKWGGNDAAKREVDQVAWNIVSMGTYASNLENTTNAQIGNEQDWPDGYNLVFMRATNTAGPDASGNYSPTSALLTEQAVSSPAPVYIDPNRCLRVGKLSGKAIMPFNSKPRLNEVALVVNAIPVNATTKPYVYYLEMGLSVELYAGMRCPPGSFWEHFGLYFDLTHLFYKVTDANNNIYTQTATGSSAKGDAGASDNYAGVLGLNAGGSGGSAGKSPFIKCMGGYLPATATSIVPADGYMVLQTPLYGGIYVCSGSTMQTNPTPFPSPTPPATPFPNPSPTPTPPTSAVQFSHAVTIQAKARIALYAGEGNNERTWEIVPVWDNVNCTKPALATPQGQQDSVAWNFTIDLDSLPTSGGTFTRSLEIADARLGGGTNDQNGNPLWVPYSTATTPTTPQTPAADSLGGENYVSTTAPLDLDDYSWLDAQNNFYPNSPRPSIGFLSCIPTGMQRGLPSQTLTFGPSTSNTDLPDWLLLDLLAPALQDTLQPVPAPLSYLHSTMGKLNINALINPLYPSPAATRTLPMQALFKNMVPDSQLVPLANHVVNHNLSGLDWGAPEQYDYIGELCEVAGVADTGTTNWQKEVIIRNLANVLTTQSNTFKVYGLAQVVNVQKKAGNTNYAAVEAGDTVTVNGEKRFESVIERSVWPGVDGVPGNAHATSGTYDQIAQSSAAPLPAALPWAGVPIPVTTWVPGMKWAQFDGPDDPTSLRTAPVGSSPSWSDAPTPGWYNLTYNYSTLKTAANPARAHMTYKPISFRYVTN